MKEETKEKELLEKLAKQQEDIQNCSREINEVLKKYGLSITIAQNIQVVPKKLKE